MIFNITDEIFWSNYILYLVIGFIALAGVDEYFANLKAKKQQQKLGKVYVFPTAGERRTKKGAGY